MKGCVALINRRTGMFAVDLDDDGYTVVEPLGGNTVAIGDVISGALDMLGSEMLVNETQRERIDAIIQAIYCTRQNAVAMLAQ